MKRSKLATRLLCTIALGISAVVSFHVVRAQSVEEATALLRDAIDSEAHVSYVGEVQNVQIGEDQSNVTIYRVEHLAPDLTRYWYLAPQSLYGDSIVARGETSYSVDVKRDSLIVEKNDVPQNEVTLDTNFALLLSNYRPLLAPDEVMLGRPSRVILLVNKHTGTTTMRLYLDAATHLVLEKDRYAPNGSLTSQIRFQQIRYTSAIPDAIFSIPRGFKETEDGGHGAIASDFQSAVQQAGFQARSPRYLPDGFVPSASDVSEVHGVRTLHILYSDGIRTLSLFENVRGAAVNTSRYRAHTMVFADESKGRRIERRANYVEAGPITLFAWSEADLHLALVGELAPEELAKIAASIVP